MFPNGQFSSFGESDQPSPYLAALMGVGQDPVEVPEPYTFGDVSGIDLPDFGAIDLTPGAFAAGEGIGKIIAKYKKPKHPSVLQHSSGDVLPTESEGLRAASNAITEGVQGANLGATAGPVGAIGGGLMSAVRSLASFFTPSGGG